ncbi:OLC1v1017910C1 [Oldenlandia corymbosa var. corymbosa]|uniref:OLC1v1017910C1 n=1 Tax=Oldenlandia corymbosa var. corymbosa TaxID=529605 RepID=A0AAV1EAS7_OLDCO|nr:OLC1v1017910C1 [Oldenlandia corymbosa var. corymbosa]
MERFAQRESVLLGYSPHRSFENSPRKSDANPDMDFSDVFGGPPRRFSVQESKTRYSFCESAMDSEPEDDAAVVSRRNPWSFSDEKPVFGAENANRRTTCPGDDFFDDIFRVDENKSFNSPRKSSSWDIFGSSPGSRASSPSRALPAKAELFSSSVPAQFSLPAKAKKTTDFPPLDFTMNHGPFHKKDGMANGINSGISSSHLYRKSPLSQEVSDISQETSTETKSEAKNVETKLKKSGSISTTLGSGQFHFSIYKWAESDVPLLISLGEGNKSRLKDRLRADNSSNSNGRLEGDRKITLNEGATSLDTESVPLNIRSDSSKEKNVEPGFRDEEVLKIPETKLSVREGNDIPQSDAISTKSTEEKAHSKKVTNKKEAYVNKGQTPKIEQKPLHELLNEDNQEPGNAAEGKGNKVKHTDTATVSSHKKNDSKKRSDVSNNSFRKSETNSGDIFGRSRMKGKVGEFVKIFNQDSSEKTKNDFRSKSTRWKKTDTHAKENGASNAVKTEESMHRLNDTKMPESSTREDDNFMKNEVQKQSHSKTSFSKVNGVSNSEKNASMFSELASDNNGIKVEDRDEPLHEYFQVEELSNVEDKDLETNGESDHIQASNAKIQQWSSGRKGNIRSLLSTLQFVLWPQSGWKPVPLVDLIEASAVKRAYQRALLCLHPDKLQQKGAASDQKYIAQQVFDILQEAWDLYNTLGAI